jgi:RNA polymerase sigma factor (sigma-70 family)
MSNLTASTFPTATRKSHVLKIGVRGSEPTTTARNRDARTGEPTDKQSIVEANMRLAPYGVQRFLRRYHIPAAISLDSDDLLSEAFLALCQAAESWDPARGTFATYAVAAIQNRLLKVCRLERGSTIADLEFISLDAPVGENGERTLEDLLPAAESPEEKLVDTSRLEVQQAIAELPERDRSVVLGVMSGASAASIARGSGCSPQRVRQIQMRAYHRLRVRLGDQSEPASTAGLSGRRPKAAVPARIRRTGAGRRAWQEAA